MTDKDKAEPNNPTLIQDHKMTEMEEKLKIMKNKISKTNTS